MGELPMVSVSARLRNQDCGVYKKYEMRSKTGFALRDQHRASGQVEREIRVALRVFLHH
jgi:hypothetical protein